MKIRIQKDGSLRFIYSDRARALLTVGEATITRASDVEPQGTQWVADLRRCGGPTLPPMETRAAALEAEVAWLNDHLGDLRGS